MKMNKKQPILTSFVIVLPALLGGIFLERFARASTNSFWN